MNGSVRQSQSGSERTSERGGSLSEKRSQGVAGETLYKHLYNRILGCSAHCTINSLLLGMLKYDNLSDDIDLAGIRGLFCI